MCDFGRECVTLEGSVCDNASECDSVCGFAKESVTLRVSVCLFATPDGIDGAVDVLDDGVVGVVEAAQQLHHHRHLSDVRLHRGRVQGSGLRVEGFGCV